MNEKKERSRTFLLVLYPDDETHKQAIDQIRNKAYNYAIILHNKDLDESGIVGSFKKEHWHVILKFPNALYKNALAETLGIQQNYIIKCNSLKESLLYLVHWCDKTKHQYSIDEVEGPLKSTLIKTINNLDLDLDNKSLLLIEYIEAYDNVLLFEDFFKWACYNGFSSAVFRSYPLWKDILNRHNLKYHADPKYIIGSSWNYKKVF